MRFLTTVASLAIMATTVFVPVSAQAETECMSALIAHRGGLMGYTEGGLKNIGESLATGRIEWIEDDVRTDKSGRLWILHDPTLDRTTNGTGPISKKTTAQVQALRMDDGETLPTLAQYVSYVSSHSTTAKAIVHVKSLNDAGYRRVARRISHYKMVGRVYMMGSKSQMAKSRLLVPGVKRIDGGAVLASNMKHEAGSIRPASLITQDDVDTVHSFGTGKIATSNNASTSEEWDRLRRLDVDGLFIDDPRAYMSDCDGRTVTQSKTMVGGA